jgi:hypothetical protein
LGDSLGCGVLVCVAVGVGRGVCERVGWGVGVLLCCGSDCCRVDGVAELDGEASQRW